jgi:hypothetical protein
MFTLTKQGFDKGEGMPAPCNADHIALGGFKKWGKEISFADLAISKSLEHNRSLHPVEYLS